MFLSCSPSAPAERSALSGGDGEVDVPGERLRRQLVRDLDFEAVIASRKRSQRHGLTCLQLVTERHVERGRQRRRIQRLRARLVEELFRRTARLLIEVVLD